MKERVAVPDRRLNLERRQNADLAQLLRIPREPCGGGAVFIHLREAYPG